MILVGLDGLAGGLAARAVPDEVVVLLHADDEAQLPQFVAQGFYAVGLLDFQRLQSVEVERDAFGDAGGDDGLHEVGGVHEVVIETWHHTIVLA